MVQGFEGNIREVGKLYLRIIWKVEYDSQLECWIGSAFTGRRYIEQRQFHNIGGLSDD